MIQVKINPEILDEVVQPYDVPILVHSPYYAIIVLASIDCGDSFKGTVISSTNPECPIGKYYEHWEKSNFYIINDEIILKNEEKDLRVLNKTIFMNIEIKSIFGEILFSFEKENNTIKDTLLEAYLEGINLEYSDLKKANLEGINLKEINLKGSDLRETNLRYSDFRNANLEDVDFNESDLKGINLENANLKGANISNTNLNCANLNGANLENIKYSIYTTFLSLQCPSEGSFMGWKRIDKYIIKLKIPEDSERSSSTNIICRCSKAEVLEIQNLNGSIADITEICSNHDKTFIYKVGEIVEVKNFDKNRWNKFSNGIHFFIDRNMAVVYGSNLLGIKNINLYLKQY